MAKEKLEDSRKRSSNKSQKPKKQKRKKYTGDEDGDADSDDGGHFSKEKVFDRYVSRCFVYFCLLVFNCILHTFFSVMMIPMLKYLTI